MPVILDRSIGEQWKGLEWSAKQAVEGFITGLHKSPFHGFSVEFAEHRLYNTGDSLKHLDWKLMARTDKMFLKRYEEETNLRCQLVIDMSSSMFYPENITAEGGKWNKFKFAVFAAAALIELFRRQRDAVGVTLFQNGIQYQTKSGTSPAHLQRIYHQLEEYLQSMSDTKSVTTDLAQCLHEVAESLHRRSLVIVFSDMLENTNHWDDFFSSLQHLKHNKHEVVVFHTGDAKTEWDFSFDNRPYTFVDPETLLEVKLNPMEVKDIYMQKMTAWRHSLSEKCGQYGIDWVEADIHAGYTPVLLEYLIKRQKMV
jgi:uncharacterized protein (DUF58 family)